MFKAFSRLASGAAIFAATVAPLSAHAVIIDFEGEALVGPYFAGESFTQAGFVMTQLDDFGTVDKAAAIAGVAPTGNATQFYSNFNDGYLELTALNGSPFSLTSFAAAFVPLSNPTMPQNLLLLAIGTTAMGDTPYQFFSLGDTTSRAAHYPFLSFSNFAPLTNLVALDFFMCAVVGNSACGIATRNNAQYALDNINLTVATPVPEPETTALMALGLMVLAAVSRRRRSR